MNILLFGGVHLEPDNLEAAVAAAADGNPPIVAPHPRLTPLDWLDALSEKVAGLTLQRHFRRALGRVLVTGNRRQVGCIARFLRDHPLVEDEALVRALRRSYALDADAARLIGLSLSRAVRAGTLAYDAELRRHLRTPGADVGLTGAWVWADRDWWLDKLPDILHAHPEAGVDAIASAWRGLGRRGLARLGAELILQLPRLSAPVQRRLIPVIRRLHRACKESTHDPEEPRRAPADAATTVSPAPLPSVIAPRLDLRAVGASGPRATWVGEDGARYRIPLRARLRPGDYRITPPLGGATMRVSRLQLASWALTERAARELEDQAWESWWAAARPGLTDALLRDPHTRALAAHVPMSLQELLGKSPAELLPDAPPALRLGLVLAALGARAATVPNASLAPILDALTPVGSGDAP